MRVETIDLNFLGTEQVIASFLLLGGGSAAIVESGPTSCLEHLRGGLKANCTLRPPLLSGMCCGGLQGIMCP